MNVSKRLFREIHGFWPEDEACKECDFRRSTHNPRDASWNGHEFVSKEPKMKARR